eukprot:TRINITY_DN6143_c0_g1_i3.p1 TRINITY_DN6143_c0_g1~~TRINITY_DN6143_c0_g1_i3.p1  ORF type:complete len:207 (+),score=29.98 TRINITY_DN6143_c0_g1_i3:92-712(+)
MTTSSSDLTFADLPDELSEVILSFLSAKELLVAGQVNKRFRAFSLRQEPWEIACREINIWPPVLEDSVAAKKGRRRKMTKYRQAVNDFAVTMQQQPQFRDLYFFHLSQRREERENSLRYAYYERLANRLSLTTTIVAAIAGIGLLVFVVLVPIKYDGLNERNTNHGTAAAVASLQRSHSLLGDIWSSFYGVPSWPLRYLLTQAARC